MSDINKQKTGSSNPIQSRITVNNHGDGTGSSECNCSASQVTYDNTLSGLSATDVQAALDLIAQLSNTDQCLDGGFANSVFLPEQCFDGGGAS